MTINSLMLMLSTLLLVDGVTAQNDGGISWGAVGISWIISTITTCVLIGVAFAIQRCCGGSKHDVSDESSARNTRSDTADETAYPVAVNGRKMAPSARGVAAQRTGRSGDVEESSLVTSSAPINTDQHVHRQTRAESTANVESETRRHDNNGEVRDRRLNTAAATVTSRQPADLARQSADSTGMIHQQQQQLQQAPDERDPNRQRQPLTVSEARPAVSESHRTPSVQLPPSQAQRQTAPIATARPTVNELRNDHRTTSVSGDTASVARQHQQPAMTVQPLSVASGQLQLPGEMNGQRQVRGRVTHGQGSAARVPEPHKLNPAANYLDDEPAEPMRSAPRSERHRQQQMLKSSHRQSSLAQDAGPEDIAACRQRNSSPDAQLAATSGRRVSSSSTSESDTESTSSTESVSESTSATPRNIALLMRPIKPPESSVTSALQPALASSSVFPTFTSRPAVQKAGLLRPEPRHVRQTVRRRPSSLDNTALEKTGTSSTALLSGDHDSRLTAWQRVQASMRPAHSDPIISSQRTASASSVQQVSASSQRTEAKIALPPAGSEQTSTSSAIGRPTSLELRKPAAPVQQRLRQVVRDPSANPSPPVAIVQPSTSSNVAILKADNGDRRRRQRHEQTDVHKMQAVSASAQSHPTTRRSVESSSRTAETQGATSSGGTGRSRTTTSTGSRRTGGSHETHRSKDFSSPGPMGTSTPGPSTPETKRSKKQADLRNIMTTENNSAPIGSPSAKFYGLLSDDGLRQMARSIGNDWRPLASALRLPSSSLSGATSTYEVLRDWRDSCSGDVRRRLCDALVSARRGDLAQKLVDEKTTSNVDKLVTVV